MAINESEKQIEINSQNEPMPGAEDLIYPKDDLTKSRVSLEDCKRSPNLSDAIYESVK